MVCKIDSFGTCEIVNKLYRSGLLVCFGNRSQDCDLSTAVGVMRASGAEFLPINTHSIFSLKDHRDLPLGYSGVTLGQLENELGKGKYTFLVNTNYASNAVEAVERAEIAAALSGATMVKLEVLDSNHKPVASEVLKAAETLRSRGYGVMPLIQPDIGVGLSLANMGCIVIRVLGAQIGSLRGLKDNEIGVRGLIQNLQVPVVVDGGIGHPMHVEHALRLGAAAVLVNTALYVASDPIGMAYQMRIVVQRAKAISANMNEMSLV